MTFDAVLYFAALALWSAFVAYFVLFSAIPYFFGKKKHHAPAHSPKRHAPKAHHAPVHHAHPAPRRRRFSSHEGFRSFAEGLELTVDDIVKGLARED